MADSLDTQIANMRLFAQVYAANANNALYELKGIVDHFAPSLGPTGEANVVPPTMKLKEIPDMTRHEFQRQQRPIPEALVDARVPSIPPVPEDNTGEQPEFKSPDKPANLVPIPLLAPTLEEIEGLPILDVMSLITSIPVPKIKDPDLPSKPSVVIPEIAIRHPGDPPPAPTDLPARFQGAYAYASSIMATAVTTRANDLFRYWFPNHAAGLAALEARLDAWLRGEFDFDDDIAYAITELTRDQIGAEFMRNEQEAIEGPGKRGFTYPDQQYLAAVSTVADKRADANARGAMDLRKVRFEYQQKMLEMAVANARDLRTSAMGVYVNMFQSYAVINGQCIDFAKAFLDALVEVYNAQVKAYTASLEAIRAEADIAEIRLKSALAVLEIYKSEIEAARLVATVDEIRLRQYEAALRSVQAIVDAYKAQGESITVRANLERLKFEAFDSQVKAFVAISDAKEAEYKAMSAQIAGEVALQDAWANRVKARSVEIEAYKVTVEALMEQLRGLTQYNESVTRRYAEAMRAYEIDNNVEKTIIETAISEYRATTEGTTAMNRAMAEEANMKLKEWEVSKELILKRADQSITRARNEMDGYLRNLQLQVEVARAMGANLQGIATAALSGINSVLSKNTTVGGTA